ncbi:hypothetical protein BV22DRAFT_1046901 [Leucogyrophana mollusca]|uniref:Uncharacterized protein n=1 Tax=Leucogyrophana mollusca TaxID=85980 RepID=A0ACB8BHM2_9AGAM|nr:hypothetical protein BV22DRAFT_1046901 [Leucogyrophana mollusca]
MTPIPPNGLNTLSDGPGASGVPDPTTSPDYNWRENVFIQILFLSIKIVPDDVAGATGAPSEIHGGPKVSSCVAELRGGGRHNDGALRFWKPPEDTNSSNSERQKSVLNTGGGEASAHDKDACRPAICGILWVEGGGGGGNPRWTSGQNRRCAWASGNDGSLVRSFRTAVFSPKAKHCMRWRRSPVPPYEDGHVSFWHGA